MAQVTYSATSGKCNSFDWRPYSTLALLSVFVCIGAMAAAISCDSLVAYQAMIKAAKNVTIANVNLARQISIHCCWNVFFLQFFCLAPMAAIPSAFFSCLFLRTFSKDFRKPGATELIFSLLPAPLIALLVFSYNPHVQFQLPFDPMYWRTASEPAERGRMVNWLLTDMKFEGMNEDRLRTLLGEPDTSYKYPDSSGYFGYNLGALHGSIVFYFDESGKVTSSDREAQSRYGIY